MNRDGVNQQEYGGRNINSTTDEGIWDIFGQQFGWYLKAELQAHTKITDSYIEYATASKAIYGGQRRPLSAAELTHKYHALADQASGLPQAQSIRLTVVDLID
ncbi:MAG: hypothetical protein OSA23_10005 [Rhodospirillales bacterium]|nr:hypothetical protein [Rhodospirillales bacterium]